MHYYFFFLFILECKLLLLGRHQLLLYSSRRKRRTARKKGEEEDEEEGVSGRVGEGSDASRWPNRGLRSLLLMKFEAQTQECIKNYNPHE